jgi:cyclase
MEFLWGVVFVLLLVTPAWPTAPADFQEVARGVFVALQPAEERFNDSNSTIIVLDDSVVVVDTQTTLTATRAVLDGLRKRTAKPVRWIINTHWHSDHVQGNQVYREAFPQVQFIAQANTREDMERRAAAELKNDLDDLPKKIERYRAMLAAGKSSDGEPLTSEDKDLLKMRIELFSKQLPDLQRTHLVLPDLTFGDSLTLYGTSEGKNREIRLMHYAGHTRGDVVAYLPAEKILITGDLCDDMPYTGHGSPAELVKTLRQLDQIDFDVMIPGHGGVKRGHDHLRLILALFESIVAQAQKAVQSGLTLEDAKKTLNVEEFRVRVTKNEEHANRAFDGFIPAAFERAYLEAKNGPQP